MTQSIDALLDYVRLTHEYAAVERTMYVQTGDRMENDLEHASQVALVAWHIASLHAPDLSLEKIFRYALVHDLVEVYAGDVFFYDHRNEVHGEKERREREALEKIRARFPHFSALYDSIVAYETRDDAESRFIYALDKLLPILNSYLERGKTWKEKGISLSEVIHKKRDRIGDVEPIRTYFEEIVERLRAEEEQLFSSTP